jgi:hypothetical protein
MLKWQFRLILALVWRGSYTVVDFQFQFGWLTPRPEVKAAEVAAVELSIEREREGERRE